MCSMCALVHVCLKQRCFKVYLSAATAGRTLTAADSGRRKWHALHTAHCADLEGQCDVCCSNALEDPWVEPKESMFTRSVSPEKAPDKPTYIEMEFERVRMPVGVGFVNA